MERSEIQEAVFTPDSAALHLGYVLKLLASRQRRTTKSPMMR